jgi:hypothetical protein
MLQSLRVRISPERKPRLLISFANETARIVKPRTVSGHASASALCRRYDSPVGLRTINFAQHSGARQTGGNASHEERGDRRTADNARSNLLLRSMTPQGLFKQERRQDCNQERN